MQIFVYANSEKTIFFGYANSETKVFGYANSEKWSHVLMFLLLQNNDDNNILKLPI